MERKVLPMFRKGTVLVLISILALDLAACAPAAAPTPTPTKAPAAAPTTAPAAAPTKASEATKPPAATPATPAATAIPRPANLKVGTIQTVADAGVYLAMDKGYFKEQGIDIELVTFRTIAEVIGPLSTGQLDVVITSISQPFLAANDRGLDLKIVASAGDSMPKWEFAWIVLRKDLADKVKTPADLKGQKLAILSQGSIADEIAQTLAEQGGLKTDDAERLVIPFAEQIPAYSNKAVAAGFTLEPLITLGVQAGAFTKWIPSSQVFGGRVTLGIIVYGPSMLKDQDVARRWMIAYLKGNREYLKAFTTKEGRDQAISAIVKYSTVKEPKLYDVIEMPYIDPNGQFDMKSLETQFNFYVEKKLYEGKKTLKDLMDTSYAEFAVQRLGKQ